MTTPATPVTAVTPNRRRFLSLGGLLAGAGTLGLPRSRPGPPRSGRDAAAPAAAAAPDQSLLAPIYPRDRRYGTLRMGFNRRWVGAPAYIQVVRSATETVAAVQWAHDAGLRITVRGGGHCYENFSAGNDGGVIIDLSGMQAVRGRPDGRAAVAGGATLWNVYETLFKDADLTMPAGIRTTCSTTPSPSLRWRERGDVLGGLPGQGA